MIDITEKIHALENKICVLQDLGLIEVTGDDAEQFLQNMSTNDFGKIESDELGYPGAFCNPKGRVIAKFIACHCSDGYHLALPKQLTSVVIEHLSKFKLMAKVEIKDSSESYNFIGLTVLSMPVNGKITTGLEKLMHIKKEDYDAELEKYRTLYEEASSNVWRLRDILSVLPWVYPETSEKLIPQSLNMDLDGTVSFEKGCYPGQEVVTRLHHLGKPKKRTHLYCLDSEQPFKIGDDVYVEGQDAPCGTIVDTVCHEGETYTLAAVNIKDRKSKLISPQSGTSLGEMTWSPCDDSEE